MVANEWIRPDEAIDNSMVPTHWANADNAIDASAETAATAYIVFGNSKADLRMWYGSEESPTEKLLSKVWVKFSATAPCYDGQLTWHIYAYYDDGWQEIAGGMSRQIQLDGEYEIDPAGKMVKGFRFTITFGAVGPDCIGKTLNGSLYDVKGWEIEAPTLNLPIFGEEGINDNIFGGLLVR